MNGRRPPARRAGRQAERSVDIAVVNAARRRSVARPTRARALGGEQVEGRHAVRELLLAGTRRTREILLASDLDPAPIIDDIIDLADENKVRIREVGRNKFESMARTDAPQGVLALAAPLREHELDDLMGPDAAGRPPFLLLVDGVTDPGNLGALLRTAECAGVTGVVLPRHRAAHVTPTVTKAAAGAIEHLAHDHGARARRRTCTALSARDVWTVGLDAAASTSLFDLTLADAPVALVLGAEGAGLSKLVRQRCDVLVSIPLRGRLNSLNVSVAGALACFEVTCRRP